MYSGQEVSFPGFWSGQVGLLTTLVKDFTSQTLGSLPPSSASRCLHFPTPHSFYQNTYPFYVLVTNKQLPDAF